MYLVSNVHVFRIGIKHFPPWPCQFKSYTETIKKHGFEGNFFQSRVNESLRNSNKMVYYNISLKYLKLHQIFLKIVTLWKHLGRECQDFSKVEKGLHGNAVAEYTMEKSIWKTQEDTNLFFDLFNASFSFNYTVSPLPLSASGNLCLFFVPGGLHTLKALKRNS